MDIETDLFNNEINLLNDSNAQREAAAIALEDSMIRLEVEDRVNEELNFGLNPVIVRRHPVVRVNNEVEEYRRSRNRTIRRHRRQRAFRRSATQSNKGKYQR